MKPRSLRQGLTRRDFIAVTSAAAVSHVAATAGTGGEAKNLATHIHPEVKIDREELDTNDNAFWDWEEAVNKLTSLSEYSEQYRKTVVTRPNELSDESEFVDAVGKAQYPSAPFPQHEARDCAREWLNDSAESMRLVERGIAKGEYQIPRAYLLAFSNGDNTMDELSVPRHVARLKTVHYRHLLHRGDQGPAAKALSDLIKIADMVTRGDGYLVHYLTAMAAHALAMDAVNEVTFHPKCSHDTLNDIRRLLLTTRPKPESLARVFRMEVTHFAREELARLPQSESLPELVDALMKQHFTLGDEDLNGLLSSDEQAGRVREGLLRLFEGHPKPFDAADTMKIYSGVVATMIGDLSSPWTERKKELTKPWFAEIEPWPEALSFINDLSFLLFGDEKDQGSVTNQDIDEARKALLRVHNPVGKHILHYLDSFEVVRRSYHIGLLRWDVALVLIACRMFFDKQRRLPHRLSELVDAHLVEGVPLDPFSGQEIQYDAERRLIWSFGVDEEDHGGDWDFDAESPDGNDLVWRIHL